MRRSVPASSPGRVRPDRPVPAPRGTIDADTLGVGVPRQAPRRARSGRPRSHQAHPRPFSQVRLAFSLVVSTIAVFVLAVLLLTGTEVALDHPLPSGARGETSLGDLLHH